MSENKSERPIGRTVVTDSWRLEVPAHVTPSSPLLVVPTVHPRGDRRIIRCAQVALDAGFRLHFIWLGEGRGARDPAVQETLLPAPRSARERIGMVRKVAKIARRLSAAVWHIHDYYFLPTAKRWRRQSGNPVLYDVHEYYADYYSAKLPLPAPIRRIAARLIEKYQVRAARQLGAANVVTEQMAASFIAGGVPVSVSPNYPLLAQFNGLPRVPFSERRWEVLHTGTLSAEYGTHLIVQLAQRAGERELPFKFSAIARFPSQAHEHAFQELLSSCGNPNNLKLISPRPAHEMPAVLAAAGFGLSLLAVDGQNEEAVPSKNYEYVMAGLVDVVSDRAAQGTFAAQYAVGVQGHGDQVDVILDKMLRLASDADRTDSMVRQRAEAAREFFTWERGVEPMLRAQLLRLIA